jgi:RNA polymerase primary sigma factor
MSEMRRPLEEVSGGMETVRLHVVQEQPETSGTAMNLYLNRIGRYPLIDQEKEEELSVLIHDGQRVDVQAALEGRALTMQEAQRIQDGVQARHELVQANLRLVVSVARRYPLPVGTEFIDLVQEGNLGLNRAAEKYIPTGGKFSTYAYGWIRQSIGRYLHNRSRLVRLPNDVSEAQLAATRQTENSDPEELEGEFAELHQLTTNPSLNQAVEDDELGDLIEDQMATNPETVVMKAETVEELYSMIASLPDPRVRQAMALRFGLLDDDPHTLKQIGEKLGITYDQTRALTAKGVVQLREKAFQEGFSQD